MGTGWPHPGAGMVYPRQGCAGWNAEWMPISLVIVSHPDSTAGTRAAVPQDGYVKERPEVIKYARGMSLLTGWPAQLLLI